MALHLVLFYTMSAKISIGQIMQIFRTSIWLALDRGGTRPHIQTVMHLKSMQKEPKLIISSLLAPIASLLVPAILSIFTILTDSLIHYDDAPVRAAGFLLLVVLPMAYPVLAVFMAAVGYILKKVQKLSLRNLLIVNGLVCIPIAFCFGRPSPFGLKDQLIGLTVFFPLTALCLGLGAYCWWFLAVGHIKRV